MNRILIPITLSCFFALNLNALHWKTVPSILPALAVVTILCDIVATGFSYKTAHNVELWLGAGSFTAATGAMLFTLVFSCKTQEELRISKYGSAFTLLANTIGLISNSIGYGFDKSVSVAFFSSLVPWIPNLIQLLIVRTLAEIPVISAA